jgi:uncharacterized protein (TIGR03084 family)
VDDVLDALADQHRELADLLAGIDADADWQRPSRCEGWTVADVVLHLTQTDRMAVASLEGRFPDVVAEMTEGVGFATSVDDGAALMVERDRGEPGRVLLERWRSGSDAVRSALASTDLSRRVTWVAGELSARTLATTRLAEAWIHTGDVAAAFGRVPPPTDRLRHISRLAWRTVPYAFQRAGRPLPGPVAFHLHGPDGETWEFLPEEPPANVVRGDALELCLVAARRLRPDDTALRGEGPDAEAVLDLVRTYA